ncbi:ATP-binding protein [Xylella fastidiosa subsp. pauca]|uniref:ATP-binding protein n=1 Tax=Xylella fastidiosa TaxID=2371 RepID=UPI00241D1EE1|nr:ATP-binding protein [Xylella fastidiosa]MDG5823496.1 ATP-binding protein [Xylella fastidiosa subsp. pauca]
MRGDQVKLHQVLSNLVGNAIKFTERGRINVKLRLIGENGTHHIRRFEVHDTGICISSEQQIRLFSSFSQADTSTTRLYGSTALGLAWLGKMSGRIGIELQRGVGSTLWFEIPLLKAARELNLDTNIGQRALLVCCDSPLRQRVSQLLEAHNTDVVFTEEAMEQLRQTNTLLRFDVIVVDYLSVRYNARALHHAVQLPPKRGAAMDGLAAWRINHE